MKNPEIRLEGTGRTGKGTKAEVKEKERERKNKITQVFPSAHSNFRTTFPAGDTHTCHFGNVAPKCQMKPLCRCSPPCPPSSPRLILPANLTPHSQTQRVSLRPDLSVLVAGKGRGPYLTQDISLYSHSSTLSVICQSFTRRLHEKGDLFTTSNIYKKDNNKPT